MVRFSDPELKIGGHNLCPPIWPPYASTEHDVAMLSAILHSDRAIAMNGTFSTMSERLKPVQHWARCKFSRRMISRLTG